MLGRSSLAHGAGLLIISTMLAAAPAHAKKVILIGPPIEMSDSFRATAAAAQAALQSGDWSTAIAQIKTLTPATDFEIYVAAGLRLKAASLRGDVQAQRIALSDMFKSSAVPQTDAPQLRYMAALYSFQVGNYDDTLAQLQYARTLGYAGVDADLLTADVYLRKNKVKDAKAIVDKILADQRAVGKPIPMAWYDKAISLAYQTGDWDGVGSLYRERLVLYPSTGNWRTGLSNYLSAPGMDPQIQLDLYRLQAANGAMASERDFQAYATLAERNGNNAEAKAIIEAGRSAGKLMPTQAVTAKLMKTVTPKATKEIAALPAAVKKAAAASSGSAALAVADSYFSLGQFPQAVEQYRLALSKGGVDANRVNSRLGVALARSGDLVNAKAVLAQVTGEWSDLAGFWSVWVDQQTQRTAMIAPVFAPDV